MALVCKFSGTRSHGQRELELRMGGGSASEPLQEDFRQTLEAKLAKKQSMEHLEKARPRSES